MMRVSSFGLRLVIVWLPNMDRLNSCCPCLSLLIFCREVCFCVVHMCSKNIALIGNRECNEERGPEWYI